MIAVSLRAGSSGRPPARVKIFFDGGCRPNPGRMEIAVFARGTAYIDTDLGHGSSMEAEWLALIAAQRFARELGLGRAGYVLMGDAAAVIAQANGTQRISAAANLAVLLDLADGTLPLIRYVKRGQNHAGIALARRHIR